MKTTKLLINTKTQKYPIFIGSNLVSNFDNIIKKNSINFNQCLLLIDNKVPKKNIKKLIKSLKNRKVYTYLFNANEINKNLNNTKKILNILLKKNFSRQDCLIAVGGGITGDVGGFVASLFKRGLQFINIPTTLLSQVDSSIGGKTGINTFFGKNLIGTFYQPKLVISDSTFLKTLPKREIISGYGEILKHSLIANKKFFLFLNKNIKKIIELKSPFIEKAISESCNIKKKVVERDEREDGLRKILNFGHTFAHAYEATLGFSSKLNHGEAVLLGINIATKFSLKKKIIKHNEYSLIINHFKKLKIPSDIKNYFSLKNLDRILLFMTKDKKNISDKISLILLKKIGYPVLNKQYSLNSLKL